MCRGSKFLQRICCASGRWIKQSITFVVQTIPEVIFNGQWLAEKISDNIDNLTEIGFCVRGIVVDNTSYKVLLPTISQYKCVFSTDKNNPLIYGSNKRLYTYA